MLEPQIPSEPASPLIPLTLIERRKPRIGLALSGIMVVGVVGIGAYLTRPLDVAREYGIETPAVPSPNAHDAFLAAAPLFRSRPVAQVLDFTADQNLEEDPRKYPLAQKQAWVNENARGFQAFDAARKLPYFYPPVRSLQSNGEVVPPFEMRQLAKYLQVRTQVWGQMGQSEKAAQSALDIWEMGLKGAQGASLTPTFYSSVVEFYARRSLNPEIAHLSGPEATRAARRLEKLLASRVTTAQIWREERNTILFQFSALYDKAVYDAKQDKKIKEALERDEPIHFDTSPPPRQKGPIVNFLIRRMSSEYAQGMDRIIADAATPWPSRNTQPETGVKFNETTNKLIDLTAKSRFSFEHTNALSQIFLTRLALHGYRKDKGFYPAQLNALVPAYLTKVPLDPFTANQELRYRLDGKRYKLWSVGPDARDDGGKPAENPLRPKSHFLVKADSSGDIVANISR